MPNELSTSPVSPRATPAEEREHNSELMAKRVTDVPTNMQLRAEYNADGTEKYVGYAAMGITSATDKWLLRKFTYTSGQVTLIQSAYDSWDNRASASYS